jgi:4-alpha-glucanotransferase
VAYPGSHDADCEKTWCKNISGDARKRFNRECPHKKGQSRTYDLLEFALNSSANLTVVPMQDYLELTNEEGRMNIPSVAEGNWTWRLSPRYRTDKFVKKVKNITERTNRAM